MKITTCLNHLVTSQMKYEVTFVESTFKKYFARILAEMNLVVRLRARLEGMGFWS